GPEYRIAVGIAVAADVGRLPLGVGMNAEQPQRGLPDHPERVRGLGRHRYAVASLQSVLAILFAQQPNLGLTLDDEQQLGVGMKVHRRLIAWRGRLDTGAHRRVAVGNQRMVERERPELDARGVRQFGNLERMGWARHETASLSPERSERSAAWS